MWLKLLRSPVTCIFLKDSDDKLRALYGYMYDMHLYYVSVNATLNANIIKVWYALARRLWL